MLEMNSLLCMKKLANRSVHLEKSCFGALEEANLKDLTFVTSHLGFYDKL